MSDRRQRTRQERSALDSAAIELSHARMLATEFARSPRWGKDARDLLAISIGAHVAAMQRIQAQLLTPVKTEGE